MSVQASIDIRFEVPIDSIEFIERLIEKGWTVDDYDGLSYVCGPDYISGDWYRKALEEWPLVFEELKKSYKNREVFGLCLTWQSDKIGGEFVFDSDRRNLSIALTINRQTIGSTNSTDFAWYEKHILDVMREFEYEPFSYKVNEVG